MTYFPEVSGTVPFEGPDSKNPLAFHWYDANRLVAGRTMAEHLRFAVCYWHTFLGTGADPFGGAVYDRPWHRGADPMENALRTIDAAFEFIQKIGVRYWCFHDTDIAPAGASLAELFRNLDVLVRRAEELQRATGIRLLWGTANLFSHPRYTHGAATNPDPHVFACAAAQVKHALDATVALGGTGYVFWGGREGYSTLLNTDLKAEREQAARFLHMAVEYARRIGFTGRFFIEPKPKEPSKHQYDFDAATAIGFLREFGLLDDVALNIEANHATLAGHSFEHELAVAASAGLLGSIDVNVGDPTLGWDTDEFPTDVRTATLAMAIVLGQGGLSHGGLNFDAKVRRGSFDTQDLVVAHLSGMDTFARALLVADRLIQDAALSAPLAARYAGWQSPIGLRIRDGSVALDQLATWAVEHGEPALVSGRQEALERLLNDYVHSPSIR
jgi:xylose isomerase